MDARMDAESQPQPEPSAIAAAMEVEELPENRSGGAIEVLTEKVKSLMDKIIENPDNPSPILINAISAILESSESRCMKDRDQSSTRIKDLIEENHAFFQLISSKFLTDRRYSVSVHAATARLLCSCSRSLVYLLEPDILDNIRDWVMDETPETLELEILRTYSIGLLATYFTCNIHIEERVLTSGLPAKLMQILRIVVLGDANTSKKEANLLIDCFQEFKVGHNDITNLVRKSVRAAEAEARAANSLEPAAISAAGITAAEVVKTAGFEEYRKANDEEAALRAASRAASTLTDAANFVVLSRYFKYIYGDSDHSKPEVLPEIDIDEDISKFFVVDSESLLKLREKFCIQCLMAIVILGKDDGILDSLVHEKGADVCLALVQKCVKTDEVSNYMLLWPSILRLVDELAEHQKFMELFLDRGGLQTLVAVPRIPQTFHRLSNFLCTISSVQSTMRRVCALPTNVLHQVFELVFEILESQHDIARTNASLFLSTVFIYRAVIDAFDAHYCLPKLLHHLHHSASVTSGASLELTASQTQIAHETCSALHQYIRTHILSFVDSILCASNREVYNLSDEAFDYAFSQIRKDRKLGPAFINIRWPVVEKFISSDGHITMLELCQASRLTRPLHGSLQYILEILHIITLTPYSREFIVNATLSNGRVGMAVILDVISTPFNLEPEIVEPALHLLVNLVCPPPSITDESNAVIVPGQQASSIRSVINDPAMKKVEKGYRQARKAVRANNGIKVLLQLLQTKKITSHVELMRLRALTCRVLLGLAKDSEIARILTKLQLGRKLLELNREFGRQSSGGQHDRWQAELDQLTAELIAVVTNSGCARNLAASDAATPTLRRIEKADISAATPISYNPRELLLLIHQHLQASNLPETAAKLIEEAKLTPFQSSQEQIQWPGGRSLSGFFPDKYSEGSEHKKSSFSRKNKPSVLPEIKIKLKDTPRQPNSKILFSSESCAESDTPIVLPKKRKLVHLKENICSEKLTLDSVVVEYLKQQHLQCSSPITTLPPLSLQHPHACRKPRKTLDSPSNITTRLRTCEVKSMYEGINVNRKDRQFVYSRFRHRRTFHDNTRPCLTSIAFLEDSSGVACGFFGKLKVFNYNNKIVSESRHCHTNYVTHLQSQFRGETQLLLSSTSDEVRLWDASSLIDGPLYSFERVKAARFDTYGTQFAVLPSDFSSSQNYEILLYDIQTSQLNMRLTDNTNSLCRRENPYSEIHFGPLRYMLLWDGVLWDSRCVSPIHHFEEFTDFGGGGFHPGGNEVIINSEVWDLRNFKLLRSVPSLHQMTIKFNGSGDVIYAVLRRNREDLRSAIAPRRMRHSLVSSFRTLDALNYSDIATIPIERCVLDFATERTDSVVGLVAADDEAMTGCSAKIYDIGERKPIDGDYDVKFKYKNENVDNPLLLQFDNPNWNNGDYDLDMIDLGEDGEETDRDGFEENLNEDGEDDDDESDSDLSLNIYRSEDENE